MSERKTEGKDHKADADEDDLGEPDLKVMLGCVIMCV